jgi:hypothetical protein
MPRGAAGRDHANFAMNLSPANAVDECHIGLPAAAPQS